MKKLSNMEIGKMLGERFDDLKRLDGISKAEFARLYKVPGKNAVLCSNRTKPVTQ